MRVELTRQELYELVWSKPMLHVAKELGISDRGLAKRCNRHDIPIPGLGYWRRVECGQALDRIPLPESPRWDNRTIYLRGQQDQEDSILNQSSFVEEVIRYEADPANRIMVPEHIGKHHPLVSEALTAIKKEHWVDQCDRLALSGGYLDWRASKAELPRSARILTTLINALEKRGYSIQFGGTEAGVLIEGQVVNFQLWEHMKRYDHPDYSPDSYSVHKWFYRPTGNLILRIIDYCDLPRKQWKDKPGKPIDNSLNAFIVALAQGSVVLAKREEERRLRHEQYERERQEAYKAKCLEEDLLRWTNAYHSKENLERFIQFMEESDTPLPYEDIAKEKWLVWAKAYAHESFKEAFYSSFDKESWRFR